jgi:hypothetical protein
MGDLQTLKLLPDIRPWNVELLLLFYLFGYFIKL